MYVRCFVNPTFGDVIRGFDMDKNKVASELVKLAKELVAGKGKFYIEFYSKGKSKRKYYDDLDEAKKDADKIFKQTGIIVGIQEK